jgi:hypothetical protein
MKVPSRMQKLRNRVRPWMQRFMQWKFVLDILTMALITLLFAGVYIEGMGPPTRLAEHWLTIATMFFGARELGRWIGDHQSDRYILSIISHGEIYVVIFLFMPVALGMPELYKRNLSEDQLQTLSLISELSWQVPAVYLFTGFLKRVHENKAKRQWVMTFAAFLNKILGGGLPKIKIEEAPTDATPASVADDEQCATDPGQ